MVKSRVILASMALVALAAFFATRAPRAAGQDAPADVAKLKDDLRQREQILARQFAEFENSLLKLKDRLKRTGKKEDAARAEILEKVLEQSKDASIAVQFEQMVEMLKNSKLAGIADLKILDERSHKLADDLRDILTRMREDPKYSRLRDERLNLEKLIKEIERIIHHEKIVQGQTDRGKTDPKELKNNQAQVTKATGKLAKEIAKRDAKGDAAKDMKGDAKAGAKDGKSGQAKDAGSAKKGQAKDGKPKDNEPSAQAKIKTKADPKKDEPKASAKKDAKGGAKEASAGKQGKGAQAKGGDPKSGGAKAAGESKQGEAKAGQKSDGQSTAKSGGQSAPPKAGDKGDNQPPPPAGQNIASGKKQVDDAEYKMKQSEDSIAKKKNKDASDKQGQAITDLEKAKKKLEDLLRQIREEELERLLAALQARCEKMLAMQIQVQVGTEGIFRVVETLPGKKPNRQNQQDSLRLSDNEKDIVTEATKAIELLEAEGSAVAFPEVFHQVREDMMHVQRRLEVTDVGIVSQAIEKDIIDTLKEMIEALKKARQDLDAKKSQPSNAPSSPPQDQKLLQLIQELKMIRSMQLRVNKRTLVYGRMYQQREGEQTADPNIRRELVNLSERQQRIFEVTNRIAKGDNK